MNIQKYLVNTVLTVFLMASSLAVAEGKVAVVNIEQAVLQSEVAVKALDELKKQKEYKENVAELETLEKDLTSMLEKYKKDRAVMSAEKREEQERTLVDKQNDRKYLLGKLQQANKEWAERMLASQAESTMTIVKNIVEEQKIGLLLRAETGAVMHAGPSYDITEAVTLRLNALN